MNLSAVPISDLLRELAQRHGVSARDAKLARRRVIKRTRQAFVDGWTDELSRLLLVHALQHAADCGDPECDACDAILRRLEEPDLYRSNVAARELWRLQEVEAHAREFFRALDTPGPDRGTRSSAAAAALRAIVDHGEDLLTRSKFSRQERRRIAYESLGKNKAEIREMAEELGVGDTAIYNWRRQLLEGGEDYIEAARLDLPIPVEDDRDVGRLQQELTVALDKIKSLQRVISDQAEEIVLFRRYVREHYAVKTKVLPKADD